MQVRELGDHPARSGPPPEVAVVVATHGRAALLPRLVAALQAQTLPRERFEVLVVDDGSRDDTPRVLTRLAGATPLRLRALRVEPNAGPAAARNVGWRHATAPVVAFTDDDCVPEPGWLAAGLAALEDGAPAVVVGRTLPAPDQPRGPFSRTLHVEDTRHAPTCNVVYRRADLELVGGFDERLRTGEDTDLMLRVRGTGAAVVHAPGAVVHHDVSPSSVRDAVRNATRWVDLPALVARHPQVRSSHLHARVFWKPSHPRVILAAVGLTAAVGRPAAALLTLPWLHHRLVRVPLTASRRQRVASLPGAMAVDLTEVGTMVRGSLRHRTLVL